MNNFDLILNFARGIIRPVITLSAWLVILALASILILRFATQDMALAFLGVLTGSGLTFVSFWFKERSKP